jgi:hypothetical protein
MLLKRNHLCPVIPSSAQPGHQADGCATAYARSRYAAQLVSVAAVNVDYASTDKVAP